MLLEYELQGSKCLHKGIFDSTGFWVRYEAETEELPMSTSDFVVGYKLYSHFSFAFYHEDKTIVDAVFQGLVGALSGIDWEFPGVGFIREVC